MLFTAYKLNLLSDIANNSSLANHLQHCDYSSSHWIFSLHNIWLRWKARVERWL